MSSLKITIVGDGNVGKLYLLATFLTNKYPESFINTPFLDVTRELNVDGKDYSLTLWKTPGQEDYERTRALFYQYTDCLLLCYSIGNKESFKRIESTWIPEIRHFSPNVPIVLVGTKSDLRVQDSDEQYVTLAEGNKLKKEIHAFSLVECSAKEKLNLTLVFEEAVRAVEKKKLDDQRPKKSNCNIS